MQVPYLDALAKQTAAVDARAICPVADQHGGLVLYDRGRPTHYLLAGEWYTAIPFDPHHPPWRAAAHGPTPVA